MVPRIAHRHSKGLMKMSREGTRRRRVYVQSWLGIYPCFSHHFSLGPQSRLKCTHWARSGFLPVLTGRSSEKKLDCPRNKEGWWPGVARTRPEPELLSTPHPLQFPSSRPLPLHRGKPIRLPHHPDIAVSPPASRGKQASPLEAWHVHRTCLVHVHLQAMYHTTLHATMSMV